MLKLEQIDNGMFDLAFDDPGAGDADAAIATLVYAALFTDAEAPDRRVPDRYERKGWWAAPAAGSGLWYVRRQGLSGSARREAVDMVRQALADHGFADISITDVTPREGSVSSLILGVEASHNGRHIAMQVPL